MLKINLINISETTHWRISWIITLQYNSTIDQLKNIRDQIEKYIENNKDFKSKETEHAVRVRTRQLNRSLCKMFITNSGVSLKKRG